MPYQPNPNFEPQPPTNEVDYPAWGPPNRFFRRLSEVTCRNCLRRGHTIAKCMIPRTDGYVHGCALCDEWTHQTDDCKKLLDMDLEDRVHVFVSDRANMPPLLTSTNWYLVLCLYKYFTGPTIEDGYPWTPEFGVSVLNDRNLETWAEDAMVFGASWMRPVDPRTSSWEKVQETYSGTPSLFRPLMACLCDTCEENCREFAQIIHEDLEKQSRH